jgi:hypothetical protein
MKKKFLFGMIALLSVSLFVLGCSTDSDDDDDPPAGPTPAELAAQALAGREDFSQANAVGSTVTLGANVSLDEDLDIAAGVTIVTGDKTLTVPSGKSLTVDANGTIIVESGGELVIADGATGDLDGTITVKDGGATYDKKAGGNSLWSSEGSTGKYVYEVGGKAYLNGGDSLLLGPNGETALLTFAASATSGDFTVSHNAYAVNADINLNGNFSVEDGTITIAAGKTLTIAGTPTVLAIRTLYETSMITGGEGSIIILNNGNSIKILREEDVNFYGTNGTTLLNQHYTASGGNDTFTWATGLGEGNDKSGWKLSE